MENVLLLFSILTIHLLAVISPGPDFIVVVKNALSYGRRAGILTALGISLSLIIHISYSFFWLAVVISQSIVVFNTIKILWALYLIYIGYRSWKARKSSLEINKEDKHLSGFQSLKIWFLTNLLNPKATLYFLSLFTFVIKPDTSYLFLIVLSLGMMLIAFTWFSLVSVFLTQQKMQKVYMRFEQIFNKVFWGILIALGLKVALSHN